MVRSKCYFFIFGIIIFPALIWLLSYILQKNFFKMDFQGSSRVLLSHKVLWSGNLWQWHDDALTVFRNFPKRSFSLLGSISKLKKYDILYFINLYNMRYWLLNNCKSRLLKSGYLWKTPLKRHTRIVSYWTRIQKLSCENRD